MSASAKLKSPKAASPSSRAIRTKKTTEAALASSSPAVRTSALRAMLAEARLGRLGGIRSSACCRLGLYPPVAMTALRATLGAGSLPDRERLVVPAGLVILAIGGVGLGFVMWLYPPPLPLVFAGSIGLSGMLALAVARYDLAVALGILMLGVVRIEPAPPDAIFAIVIAVAAVTGRFRLEGVPLGILGVLARLLHAEHLLGRGGRRPRPRACSTWRSRST